MHDCLNLYKYNSYTVLVILACLNMLPICNLRVIMPFQQSGEALQPAPRLVEAIKPTQRLVEVIMPFQQSGEVLQPTPRLVEAIGPAQQSVEI